MKYATHFSDEQIVQALHETAARGVKKEDASDNVQPPNLCAFFNSLPVPERERLVELAYAQSAQRQQPMQ